MFADVLYLGVKCKAVFGGLPKSLGLQLFSLAAAGFG